MRNLIEGIIFSIIVIGLPILANFIVEIVMNFITIEFIMKCTYLTLGLILIVFIREAVK